MADIEHFAIYADDPTALKDFYVHTFGLRVIVDSGGIRRDISSPMKPGWRSRSWAGLRVRRRSTSAGSATSRSGSRTCWRRRPNWSGLGFVFESETFVDNDEMKTAFFKDPGGNRCQIVWRRRGRWGSSIGRRHAVAAIVELGRDRAAPFDHVAVLEGELLDLGPRLGDLDPRGLAIGPAARPLPGDFLAEPLAAGVIDDQALHPQFSAGITNSPREHDTRGDRPRSSGHRSERQGSVHPLITPTGRSRATFLEIPALSTTSTTWSTSL